MKITSPLSAFQDLIAKIWDGDVTYEEAIQGFNEYEISLISNFVWNYQGILEYGVPMKGDNRVYDNCSRNNEGCKLLNKLIANFE